MKKILITISFILTCATVGMFAAATTDPVPAPAATSQHAPSKSAKRKHKRHAKHPGKNEEKKPEVAK